MRNISNDLSGGGNNGNASTTTKSTVPNLFPVANATIPYWRTQLHPIDEHRSTPTLPAECDIAIIGAGMTGVSIAYHLTHSDTKELSNNPSIVLLEARQVCSGATGRNGGHIKMLTPTMLSQTAQDEPELAQSVFEFMQKHIYALKHVVEAEDLDCEFELRRSYDVFLEESEARDIEAKFQKCVRDGRKWTRDVDLVEEKFIEQVTSVRGAKVAFSTPACSLWPYKFVSQLLARLEAKGLVNLQTRTPVDSVTVNARSGLNELHTARGTLRARKVVFATNAYTGGLSAAYAGEIVPVRITASHVSPGSQPVRPHLTHTYNISYRPGWVDYLNPRPDEGVVIGGAKGTYISDSKPDRSHWYNNHDDSELLEPARAHFAHSMPRRFFGWENSGAKLTDLWTGIIGYTSDEMPHVGAVPGQEGRQWVVAGFNGGGMPNIFLCAEGVAKMMRDGIEFDETGVPAAFRTSRERFVNAQQEN